jgi:hypothetical protein
VFEARASFTALIRTELWARNPGVTCTARIWNLTSGASVGTSAGVTSQTPTQANFNVPILSGNRYLFEITSSANNEGVFGIGTLETL